MNVCMCVCMCVCVDCFKLVIVITQSNGTADNVLRDKYTIRKLLFARVVL